MILQEQAKRTVDSVKLLEFEGLQALGGHDRPELYMKAWTVKEANFYRIISFDLQFRKSLLPLLAVAHDTTLNFCSGT